MDFNKVLKSIEKHQNANKPSAQKVLELLGTEFDNDGNIIVDLIAETKNGKKNFGKISYSAYKAIKGNTLDSYTPYDDEEKKVLEKYKQYTGLFTPNGGTTKTDKPKTPKADKNKTIISDYVPGAYSMTKSEYNRSKRRA